MENLTEQELKVADNLSRLAAIAYDYNEYRVAEKVAQEGKKEAHANIMNYFEMTGTEPGKEVIAGLFAVKFSEVKGRDAISREKLLALGVDPNLIDLATTKGEPTKRLTVKLAADKDKKEPV